MVSCSRTSPSHPGRDTADIDVLLKKMDGPGKRVNQLPGQPGASILLPQQPNRTPIGPEVINYLVQRPHMVSCRRKSPSDPGRDTADIGVLLGDIDGPGR